MFARYFVEVEADPAAVESALLRDLEAWLPGLATQANEKGDELLAELKKTPASSEIGRLAVLLKAAGMTAPTVVAPPDPPVAGSDAAIADEVESRA
jgi:hypothetical protein